MIGFGVIRAGRKVTESGMQTKWFAIAVGAAAFVGNEGAAERSGVTHRSDSFVALLFVLHVVLDELELRARARTSGG